MNTLEYNYDDITPTPISTPSISDPNEILCQIIYTQEYKDLLSIIRPLMKSNEHSFRALHLTTLLISKVAAHYSVWEYRYEIIKSLNSKNELPNGLQSELEWCGKVALKSQKNYQIWHYRKLIIELLISTYGGSGSSFTPENDYTIIDTMIDEDSKNYHVWSYRRWLVERFELYDTTRELEFTERKIAEDVRNNSAWNHRYFVKFGKKDIENPIDATVVAEEVDFVQKMIQISPTNPSTWNYLNGIYKLFDSIVNITDLKPFAMRYTEGDVISVYAFEMLAEIYKLEEKYPKSIEIYELLGGKYDCIRVNYWNYMKSKIST